MYFLSFFPFLPYAFFVFRYLAFVRLVFYIALNGMGYLTSYLTWVMVGRVRYRKFSFTGELAVYSLGTGGVWAWDLMRERKVLPHYIPPNNELNDELLEHNPSIDWST